MFSFINVIESMKDGLICRRKRLQAHAEQVYQPMTSCQLIPQPWLIPLSLFISKLKRTLVCSCLFKMLAYMPLPISRSTHTTHIFFRFYDHPCHVATSLAMGYFL